MYDPVTTDSTEEKPELAPEVSAVWDVHLRRIDQKSIVESNIKFLKAFFYKEPTIVLFQMLSEFF